MGSGCVAAADRSNWLYQQHTRPHHHMHLLHLDMVHNFGFLLSFYLAARSHSTTLLFDLSPYLLDSVDLLLLPLVVTKVAGAYFTLTMMDLEMVDYLEDELA